MRALSATVSTWGGRLKEARNVIALVVLGAVFAFRSGVAWRRWRRRDPAGRRERIAG